MAEQGTESTILAHPIPFGKYYLLERIATGGMAEVFKAKAFGIEGFERLIAVKRILPTIAENAEFTRMFVDEAKLAGQLQHANIAQIFDLGRVDDSYYIALEYVSGRDLRTIWDRLRQQGRRIPLGLACHIMTRVLEGLEYAHNKADTSGQPLNIVHRDVSPQNVLVAYEGEVKLIDFGVAKAASSTTETRVGILKGKLSYMSPEQVRGLAVDRRSDTFSSGTMLYELVTGERLFVGESDFETLEKIRKVEVAPPTLYNPDIPRELEDLILKALQKNPNHRFESAQEMHDALQRFMFTSGNAANARDLRAFMQENFARQIAEERERHEYFQRLSLDRVSGEGAPVGGLAWDDNESETHVFSRNDEALRASGSSPAVAAPAASWARSSASSTDEALDNERTTVDASHSFDDELADHDSDDAALDAALASAMDANLAPAAPEPVAAPASRPGKSRDKNRNKQPQPSAQPSVRGGNVAPTQQLRRAPPAAAVDSRPAPAPATATAAPVSNPTPTKSGSSGTMWAIAIAVLALIGLIAFFATRNAGGAPTGTVNVVIEPSTVATVQIGNQPAWTGTLPHAFADVAVGVQPIAITADGYEPFSTTIAVTDGTVAELRRTLVARALPALAVRSTPPGARITLDGSAAGITPTSLTSLRPGSAYTLQVLLDGYEPVTRAFTATAAMEPFNIELVSATPTLVALAVNSMPPGAAYSLVRTDGTVAASGVTPGRAEGITAGSPLEVRFTLEGHEPATMTYVPTTVPEQSVAGTLAPVVAADATPPVAVPATATERATTPVAAATRDPERDAQREAERAAERAGEREREQAAAAAAEPEPTPEPAQAAATGPGRLNVASRPAGRLIIDGADTGLYTPIRGYELAPGRYRIELVNEDLGMRRRYTVQIVAGQDETIRNVAE